MRGNDASRRALARVIEGLDDVRPPRPYTIAEIVAKAEAEPAVRPVADELAGIDRKHPEFNLLEHFRQQLGTAAGGILRATDSIGRRLHGRIWNGRGAARYFTLRTFTLEQIQSMRIGGRAFERHVKVRNDGFEELERLMILHDATIAADVWDDWRPDKSDDPGVAV
jgi:hypothetical protein